MTVTNEIGCEKTIAFDIMQPDSFYNELLVIQPDDVNLGEASVTTSGGTMPYDYLWSSGSTESFNNNLLPGTYTITVTDANGCVEILEVVIESEINLDIMIHLGNCPGSCADSLSLSVSGPDVSYSIVWEEEDVYGFNPSNLCEGVYNYVITGESVAQVSGSVTIVEEESLSVTGTFDSLLCDGSTTDIILNIENGAAPYIVEWNTASDNDTLFQVDVGDYQVTVTDEKDCSTTALFSIALNPEIEILPSVTNTCIGENNGEIDLFIDNSNGPYSINWSNDEITPNISNLSVGEYSYILQDSFSCIYKDTIAVANFSMSVFTILEVLCDPNTSTYSIDYSLVGDAYPYIINGQIVNASEEIDLTALSGDSLSILIIDANQCEI